VAGVSDGLELGVGQEMRCSGEGTFPEGAGTAAALGSGNGVVRGRGSGRLLAEEYEADDDEYGADAEGGDAPVFAGIDVGLNAADDTYGDEHKAKDDEEGIWLRVEEIIDEFVHGTYLGSPLEDRNQLSRKLRKIPMKVIAAVPSEADSGET
jgi:hypothetical protein